LGARKAGEAPALLLSIFKSLQTMNNQDLLRQFEYSVIAKSSPSEKGVRALFVTADFNRGKFYMKGNWQAIIHASDEFDKVIFSIRSEVVEIGMEIFPCGVVNLLDHSNDGLIMFLKGAINDEKRVSPCTGMLVFKHAEMQGRDPWSLHLYLYEPRSGYSEIKFRFPICEDREAVTNMFRYS
jgi:hypothetical protein